MRCVISAVVLHCDVCLTCGLAIPASFRSACAIPESTVQVLLVVDNLVICSPFPVHVGHALINLVHYEPNGNHCCIARVIGPSGLGHDGDHDRRQIQVIRIARSSTSCDSIALLPLESEPTAYTLSQATMIGLMLWVRSRDSPGWCVVPQCNVMAVVAT